LDPSVSTGRGTCDSTIRQDYLGAQFGFDLGKINLSGSGANFHFGVTGGYFDVHSKEKVPSPNEFVGSGGVSNLTFPPGNFSSDTEVPFIGLYGTYTQGRFFSDVQLRFDLFRSSLTDPANGLSGETLKAHSTTLTGNLGYSIPLAGNWFIEPSAGVVWSRIGVDTFDAPGVPVVINHTITDIFGKGTVSVDSFDSVLGRASLRFGTNITAGGNVWQPFATASVFHEFADDVVTTARQANSTNSPLTISTERVGTYGQFGLGVAAVIGDTGWLGYGRVDYKIGENVEGVSANIGIRYQW
jgi:outer membrane autotransporter protein